MEVQHVGIQGKQSTRYKLCSHLEACSCSYVETPEAMEMTD